MTHPFEVAPGDLSSRLEELVDVTFGDLQSQFLALPRGAGFIEFADFQQAYETLKAGTQGFTEFTVERVWDAVTEDALVLVVVRTMLGFSPPEWADVASSQAGTEVRRARRARWTGASGWNAPCSRHLTSCRPLPGFGPARPP